MPRGQGETHILAYWFWNEILEREDDPWQNPGFPRYLAEAARARKFGYDIPTLKYACQGMKSAGHDIQSLLLPTLFSHHTNGPNWYDWAAEEMKRPPPIYEPHALREWAIRSERQDILDYLDAEQ